MSQVSGFPPVAEANARVLILGSMPGIASLEKNEYYALPRNAFWRVMGDLFGAGAELTYEEKLQTLSSRGIALWDVLKTCDRPGSLDSSIVASSMELNDFKAIYRSHTMIRHVFFNGRKASQLYMQHILPTLGTADAQKSHLVLPSTSPAMASMTYADKLDKWAAVAGALQAGPGSPSSSSVPPDD
jgi:hypoxanthine-DNA glycosylase